MPVLVYRPVVLRHRAISQQLLPSHAAPSPPSASSSWNLAEAGRLGGSEPGRASVEAAERSLATTATCRAPPKVRPWPGRSTPTHCARSQSKALSAKNENVYADGCCAQDWLITEWRDWVVMAEQD